MGYHYIEIVCDKRFQEEKERKGCMVKCMIPPVG